jgi:3-demethoxyubiquinol 3-hydroxylase
MMDPTRSLSPTDRAIGLLDNTLRVLLAPPQAQRPCPQAKSTPLEPEQAALSGALMRVNHVGEVCAQALYSAQALTCKRPDMANDLRQAAQEEMDHLAWTEQRLTELGARKSLLLPLWWAGAAGVGLAAGLAGDEWSLGFVVETERQVEAHLASHLDRLPQEDLASRAIVAQMKLDEAKHADMAQAAGARGLPAPVRWCMRQAAALMTTIAHRI